MSKASDKKVYRLPEHSLAKIALYKRYLSIYLNIIANTSFKTIYLLDLFAGEGRDVDGKACSSIAAIEALKNHFDTSNTVCKKIVVFLNDYGNSVIDKNIKKIERIKRFTNEIKLPKQYEVKFSEENFENIIEKVIQRLNKLNSLERALCFFDPWGYKYSKPQILKDLLSNGKTELLLFMPICFMHRFAAKALKDEDFIEGQHIEKFITELYENEIPDIKNQISFIKGIQKQFKKYLKVEYVDVLFIEKERNQYFALYFFSNNKRGFQKMLEAKWSIDEKDGRAFTVNRNQFSNDLFENVDYEDYSYLLYEELKRRRQMSNQEIFDFGLNNNHLPKHSKKVLDQLKKDGKIKVVSSEGANSLGYYLEDNHEKKVIIKII
jgi:three-Cys-motif partner protein